MMTQYAMQIVGVAVCVPLGFGVAAFVAIWAFEHLFKLFKITKVLCRFVFFPSQRKLANEVIKLQGAWDELHKLQRSVADYQNAAVMAARHCSLPAIRKAANKCGLYPCDDEWAALVEAIKAIESEATE